MSWSLDSIPTSVLMASRLVVTAAVGSRSQMGAPTRAASGITTSASRTRARRQRFEDPHLARVPADNAEAGRVTDMAKGHLPEHEVVEDRHGVARGQQLGHHDRAEITRATRYEDPLSVRHGWYLLR